MHRKEHERLVSSRAFDVGGLNDSKQFRLLSQGGQDATPHHTSELVEERTCTEYAGALELSSTDVLL